MKRIWVMIPILTAVIQVQGQSEGLKCTTANERCELPFYYEDERYEACTGDWVESKRPWCPTKVYTNGSADLSYCMKCWGDHRCYLKADSFPDSSWILSCPSGCYHVQKNVYGTDNEFSADSYICAAAIHQGLTTNGTGGDVVVIKQPWKNAFAGEEKNGIRSYKATKEGVQTMNFRVSFKVAPSPRMIFTNDQSKISQLESGKVSSTPVIGSQRFATGITSDFRRRKIFWTDVGRRSIISANFNGKSLSGQRVIVKGEQVLKPEVIALDWVHENLFWSDLGFHSVSVSDGNGKNILTLIKRGDDFSPRGLAVDPKNGFFYVADFGSEPKIEKCAMSGKDECETIVDEQIQSPTGIALGIDEDQMCWADSGIPLISCSRLDGTNRRNMKFSKEKLKQPFAVAMHKTRVYWTDWLTTTLSSINYKTWRDFHVHLGDLTKGGGITLYEPQAQRMYKNQCAGSPCEHLCVPEQSSFKCVCSDNYFLQNDGTSCGAAPPTAPTPGSRLDIYVADYVTLKRFNINLQTWKSDSTTILKQVRRATAVAVDTQKNTIYWSDAVSKKIEMAPMSDDLSRGKKSFLDSSSGFVSKVEGIAIDSITRLFYWTDFDLHAVLVTNLDPVGGQHYISVIINGSESYKPRGLALDPKRGYIYIVDAGDSAKIQKCESSGDTSCRSIVQSGLIIPNWVAIDDVAERLYFTSQRMIKYSDLDGQNKKDLPSTRAPYGIGVFRNRVYWNDWSGRSIMSMDKTTGKEKHTVTSTLLRPMGMFLHDPLDNKPAAYPNVCAGNKCEYLCVPSPNRRGKRYTCICPEKFKGTPVADECEAADRPAPVLCKIGFQLLPDGKTCGDILECLHRNGGCKHRCRNTIGSYFCECNQGYQIHSDGKSCKKLVAVVKDPCSNNPCLNGGTCRKNEDKGFICFCANGFKGSTCQTLDVRLVKSIDSTDSIRLQCVAPPGVKSEIIWSLDRRQIDLASSWANIRSNGRQLVIHTPHYTHSGNYSCQFEYQGIERVARLTVIVEVKPSIACGESPAIDIPERKHGPKILGGRESQLLMAPFVAMLYMKPGSRSGKPGAFCGGSLVDTKHVVTAAHCFTSVSYKDVRIYVGKLDARVSVIERMQQSSDIADVIIHPEYDPSTLHADIAMIVLKKKVYFSAGVKPICIATPDDKSADIKSRPYKDKTIKKYGIVYGWGLTKSGFSSRRLMEINLPIVSQSECKKVYPGDITNQMFCVGGEENKDACEGDSGGPFTLWSKKRNKWFLGGVVSWGIECGRSNTPGVYTRIGSKMRKWIYNIADI